MNAIRTLVVVSFLLPAAHLGARPAAGACDLLTKTEVAAVQGQEYSQVHASTRGQRSQCLFELPSFADSISLDVIRADAREYWEKTFEQESEEQEEGEIKSPPRQITGVGEEAFWVGSRTAGSLYVLQKNAVLRISIGGAASEAEKIARSKRLAQKALSRL